MITGAAFVDLFAAYDTVNHSFLVQKLYNIAQDSHLCSVLQNMLSNRRFYVELNNECSRWRIQKNGLPLTNSVQHVYINDKPLNEGTRSFIYADDLCVTTQYYSFTEVDKLTQYYRSIHLRADPEKTQVTAFHLRNNEAKQSLKVVWNKTELENTPP